MIRTPLRPLARILSARDKGENPDAIERENLRQRHEVMRDAARLKAEGRLLMLGLAFRRWLRGGGLSHGGSGLD